MSHSSLPNPFTGNQGNQEFLANVDELLRGEIGRKVYLQTLRMFLDDCISRVDYDRILETPLMERMRAEVGAVTDRDIEVDYFSMFFGPRWEDPSFDPMLNGDARYRFAVDPTYVHESLCNTVRDETVYFERDPRLNVEVFDQFLDKYEEALRSRAAPRLDLRHKWDETMRTLVARFPKNIVFDSYQLRNLSLAHACKILADRRLMSEQESARNAYDLIFSQDCANSGRYLLTFIAQFTSLPAFEHPHAVCNWLVSMKCDNEDDQSGYVVALQECHPLKDGTVTDGAVLLEPWSPLTPRTVVTDIMRWWKHCRSAKNLQLLRKYHEYAVDFFRRDFLCLEEQLLYCDFEPFRRIIVKGICRRPIPRDVVADHVERQRQARCLLISRQYLRAAISALTFFLEIRSTGAPSEIVHKVAMLSLAMSNDREVRIALLIGPFATPMCDRRACLPFYDRALKARLDQDWEYVLARARKCATRSLKPRTPETNEFLADVEELLRGEIGRKVYLRTLRMRVEDYDSDSKYDVVLATPLMKRAYASVGAVTDRQVEVDYYEVFFGHKFRRRSLDSMLTNGKFIVLDPTYVHESLCNTVMDYSLYLERPPLLNVRVFKQYLDKYEQALRTRDALGLGFRDRWEETMRTLVAMFPTKYYFTEEELTYLALAHACKILADRRLMTEQESARNAYDLIFSQDWFRADPSLFMYIATFTSLPALRADAQAVVSTDAPRSFRRSLEELECAKERRKSADLAQVSG
ncbi:Hypothetical Protein FCC1311_113112 [Hondaea fermentalgiana]|uniref:Uncharacterized protein n=1 Tax=Hondaea fermentalgiana TaxID=2315210 RepID=A0A2R5GZ38_9STRA|nr:Hypothetical Protein FCC1311_113112 [Hondaea fermentalgiana]|eukprot:GBG35088.1 Hypothetical Protein FCC1311_113112 [Hondaea fermentalgiana]